MLRQLFDLRTNVNEENVVAYYFEVSLWLKVAEKQIQKSKVLRIYHAAGRKVLGTVESKNWYEVLKTVTGGLPSWSSQTRVLFDYKRIGDLARCEGGFFLFLKSIGVLEPMCGQSPGLKQCSIFYR